MIGPRLLVPESHLRAETTGPIVMHCEAEFLLTFVLWYAVALADVPNVSAPEKHDRIWWVDLIFF